MTTRSALRGQAVWSGVGVLLLNCASPPMPPSPSARSDRKGVFTRSSPFHSLARSLTDAAAAVSVAPIRLEQATVQKAKHDRGNVLAAACGDIDADGRNDLLLVSTTTVAWGRIVGASLAVVHEAPWSALTPRAAVPMREAMGTAAIVPHPSGGEVFAGFTSRGGVALSRDLRGATSMIGLPFAIPGGVGCATPDPSAGTFTAGIRVCAGRPEGVRLDALPYDDFASFECMSRDGKTRLVVGQHDPEGKLRIRVGEVASLIEGVGVPFTLGDLDQDGTPEIITTAASGDDEIAIRSLDGAEVRERLKIPAPAGVRALAVCPPEGNEGPALLAVVGAEVWVVR